MDFSPSVYEHAAHLINRDPWDVSRDGNLLFQGNAEAYRLYHHRPVVIGIDIYNLEAEAYGAAVVKPQGYGIPVIAQHPCAGCDEILQLEPFDPRSHGRVSMVIQAGQRMAREFPDADVRIPVSGPFSIATNLIGFENLLCELMTEPALVSRTLQHLVTGQANFCREVVRHGLDIAFFESAAAPPLLSPRDFRQIELPALKKVLSQAAHIVNHPVPCVIGGDTVPILEAIMETDTGYVCCPAETDQPRFMEIMLDYPDVMVRVNMDPRPITSGNLHAIHQEVDRVMALARTRTQSCIGTGCLPLETDPQLVLKTREYILSKNQ